MTREKRTEEWYQRRSWYLLTVHQEPDGLVTMRAVALGKVVVRTEWQRDSNGGKQYARDWFMVGRN